MTEIEITTKQAGFLADDAGLSLFCGGVGSGKSHVGALWLRDQIVHFPKTVSLIGANTYLQLHKSTLAAFFRVMDQHGPEYVFGRRPPGRWSTATRYQDHTNVISCRNGAQVLCYSMENYDVIRGVELAFIWVDEARDTDPTAFTVLLERLRGFDHVYPGIKYACRVTTTPNGFDWVWDRFVSGNKLPGATYHTATSYDNPFVAPDYAATVEARLGKQLARQQIYAEFVSLTAGRCFIFSRAAHVKPVQINHALPLIFSMDFNVSPLTGVVMQIDTARRTVAVLDEIFIPNNGQTAEACREFLRRWHGKAESLWYFGDRAGAHRDTRGGATDIEIMRRELSVWKHSRDACDYVNRHVIDGIHAVNALLEPSLGAHRLSVAGHCEMLIRDLEQLSFKPGTQEVDKATNKDLSHLADCLRYPIAQMLPVCHGLKISGVNV